MSGTKALFGELRRRKVLRSAALYVVAAWVALQVADLAFPGLRVPEEAIRYVWIAALVGLPLALLFAWRYQVTGGGIVRTAPGSAPDATLPLRRGDYVVLGGIALAAAGVLSSAWSQVRRLRRAAPSPARRARSRRTRSPSCRSGTSRAIPLRSTSSPPCTMP